MKTKWKSLIMGSIAWFGLLSYTVTAQQPAHNGGGLICSTNDYALCSHAKCECLDENGGAGNCSTYSGTDRGWSRCTCPVVISDHKNTDSLYNANFGNLDCSERETPALPGLFPTFVARPGSNSSEPFPADVYSEYSFGDSLAGDHFGTLDSAKMLKCDAPESMALCLDMPCLLNPDGTATCYCQNVATDGAQWNTLGGDCDSGKCKPDSGKIWSAALLEQTLPAIGLIGATQNLTIGTTGMPAYCD